jgi:hypothetical protein
MTASQAGGSAADHRCAAVPAPGYSKVIAPRLQWMSRKRRQERGRNPFAHPKMKRSTASRGAFAIFVALPLLPVGGIVVNAPPEVVFFMGATSFIGCVLLFVGLLTLSSLPPESSPPVAKRFHFTIRDLICLTTVVFGMTVFMISAFRCEAAERASRPGPLPAALYRQFAWELEAGLVCMAIGGLMWIRPACLPGLRPSGDG